MKHFYYLEKNGFDIIRVLSPKKPSIWGGVWVVEERGETGWIFPGEVTWATLKTLTYIGSVAVKKVGE